MSLLQQQNSFATHVAQLILKAQALGYQISLGDAFRDPRVFGKPGEKKGYGVANSYHKQRLAIDINLFKNGVYLDKTEDHAALGAWWESIGGTWGGHFKTADGNHYSWGEGCN